MVSPLRVYQAASGALKWRLWTTVGVVSLSSVTVSAQSVGGSSMSEWFSPQNIFALGGIVYGVGTLVQELRSLKKRLEDDERTYARVDVVDLRFGALMAEIAALRGDLEANDTGKQLAAFVQRFEAYLQTVQVWSARIESEIHATQKDLVRLDTRMKGSVS